MLLVIFLLFCCIAIISSKVVLVIEVKEERLTAQLRIHIFGFICAYKRNINRGDGSRFGQKSKQISYAYVYSVIKKLKLNLEFLEFHQNVWTGDAAATAVLTGIIRSVIPIILKCFNVKINQSKCEICINPIYSEKAQNQLELRCIISKKVVHIISKIFSERKREKYGRKTSNRESYGYGNE